ncbi:E3 ubiquitin-protein ligase TRIM36-like [Mytilus californianus]|uniref:E3 ubiquitin-protein ligase TRIM36-like n=1 Tax=Mytilus californianus TaxID=6549 RepID=UPI002247CB03|nr:E3 ubiquitin-protein ligase TRIM36-like [Mytilus californianus]
MAQTAASTCEICVGGPGEHYCQQCDQLFCGSCKLSHLRTKISKDHTFVSGPNINKKEKLLCTEHEETFLFYCHDCDTPVCRICIVEKHNRHLMTDLTKSAEKLRSELVKNIESKVITSRQNISKIEMETKIYREGVKSVIKTITDEGNYWKQLIDKKVEALIKEVQDKEQKEIKSMSAYCEVYEGVVENCHTWQKKIKKMETTSDILMLKKLKQLKSDVDQIVLKQIPNTPSVSYRNKKPSGTEIENLFGELQFRDSKDVIGTTGNKQSAEMSAEPQSMQKRYRYACWKCKRKQILT